MSASGLIAVDDRRGMVSVSIVVSVLLHLFAAAVLFSVQLPGGSMSKPPVASERLIAPIEKEDELRLGLNEAESASIDWLGIKQPEAVVGEAAISETDQAAQALVVGESQVVVSEEVPVEPVEEAIEVAAVEPVEQPTEEAIDQVEELVERIALPVEEIEASAEEGVVIAEAVVEEEAGEENEQTEVKQVEVSEVAQPSEAREPAVPKPKPVPAGTSGVLSKREVVATRIERAIEIDPHKPNTPIVGKGLEILTIRPRYTAAVRLSAVPANPVVVMWFDASGKVSKAEFVKDGKKVYSSGVSGVDQPLLNAIYQWRAKGKQIDELDAGDPTSLVEVSIKIVFRKERKGSSD